MRLPCFWMGVLRFDSVNRSSRPHAVAKAPEMHTEANAGTYQPSTPGS
jgi:hypothetical protein